MSKHKGYVPMGRYNHDDAAKALNRWGIAFHRHCNIPNGSLMGSNNRCFTYETIGGRRYMSELVRFLIQMDEMVGEVQNG